MERFMGKNNFPGRQPNRGVLHLMFVCAAVLFCFLDVSLAARLTSGDMAIPTLANSCGGTAAAALPLALTSVSIGRGISSPEMTASNYRFVGGPASVAGPAQTAKNNLAGAFCYPVPFKPSKGHRFITFKGLTRDAEIRIYTVAGEQVRRLVKSDIGDSLDWDAANMCGEKLASGVYLYVIKSAGSVKRGKLIVIR